MSRLLFSVGAAVTLCVGPALAGNADSPRAYCRSVGADAITKPIPPGLAGDARRALNVRMSDADIARTGVYRCMGGSVLVCVVGANLNCGKADLNTRSPAADQYCRENPSASFIPMFVTGHDTAYAWSCRGAHAVAGAPTQPVDTQGFESGVWAKIP